jgi:hypothetical protein
MSSKKTRAVIILALVIAGSVIGVAIAAWTTGGSGSGQASAGTAASMTISAGTPSTNLYPTASADVAAAVTVDGGHSACNTGASVSVTSPQDNSGAGWDVPAKSGAVNGSLNLDLANAISMSNAANDSCQGATFTVALTATGASTP